MTRTGLMLTGLIASATAVSGQVMAIRMGGDLGKPITIEQSTVPSDCNRAVMQEQNRLFAQARDTSKHITLADVQRKLPELYKQCADKFASATLSVKEMVALADLYRSGGISDKADATIARAVSSASTDADKGSAYTAALNAAVRGGRPLPPEALATASGYLAKIETLSPEATKYKVDAYMTLSSFVPDSTAPSYVDKAMAAARETPEAIRTDSAAMAESGSTLIGPFTNRADKLARGGDSARAEELFAEATRLFPRMKSQVAMARRMSTVFYSVGKPAPDFTATNWFNAPDGFTKLDLKGKPTLVMVTAFW